MLTISVTPEGDYDDLDGQLVDGLESLRQRIVQRIRFPLGQWFVDTRRGTLPLLGYNEPSVPAGIITATILDEGGAEVVSVENVVVGFDQATRAMTYTAQVRTVYGDATISGGQL